jgi:hypothetical protein
MEAKNDTFREAINQINKYMDLNLLHGNTEGFQSLERLERYLREKVLSQKDIGLDDQMPLTISSLTLTMCAMNHPGYSGFSDAIETYSDLIKIMRKIDPSISL